MKNKVIYLLIIFLMVIFPVISYAEEETTTAKKCSYKQRSELNKLAAKVEFSYDIVYENDTPKFEFTVYNLQESLYMVIDDGETDGLNRSVMYHELTDGLYKFEDRDITNIKTYKIKVFSANEDCRDMLRTIVLVKPKRNIYHDYNECRFQKTEDYVYCREWITKDFGLSEKKILDKINNERTKTAAAKTTTTECKECIAEAKRQAKIARYNALKTYFAIGLSIGISIDMIFIYLRISTLRRSRL